MKRSFLFLSLIIIHSFSEKTESLPSPSTDNRKEIIGSSCVQGTNASNSECKKLSVPPRECGKNLLHQKPARFGIGQIALGDWPWIVALYVRHNGTGRVQYECAGTLIDREWVLTAAHCQLQTWPKRLDHIRLGNSNLNSTAKDGADPIEVKIKSVIKHQNFTKRPVLNDIALVRLATLVNYTQYISPICLQSGEAYLTNTTIDSKNKPVLVGWTGPSGPFGEHTESSKATILEQVDIRKTKSAEECAKDYDEFVKRGQVKLDESFLCTPAPRHHSRMEISGSPLIFLNSDKSWSQGGIVSYGGNDGSDYPIVYTKVAAFIDWINESTGLNF